MALARSAAIALALLILGCEPRKPGDPATPPIPKVSTHERSTP
jgi:hypothetical protein